MALQTLMKKFPFYKQLDLMDCGPTCLKMIAKHYGRRFSLDYLRQVSHFTQNGVTLLGLSDAAEKIGFKTLCVRLSFEKLQRVKLPAVIYWRQQHFVVVHEIRNQKVHVADPAFGLITYTIDEFKSGWLSDSSNGITLLLEPTTAFFDKEHRQKEHRDRFRFLFGYFKLYKRFFLQIFLGLLLSSFIQLIFPFLTQSIIDIGIQQNNIGFINIILIAQLTLFASQTTMEALRSWLILHISSRVNISMVSDFLIKIMNLPMSFFESKTTGDLMQRVNDHKRVEIFLTSSILNVSFSLFSLVIFGSVLFYYDFTIFLIFFIGSIIQVAWIMFFLKTRQILDFKLFEQSSSDQSNVVELLTNMTDIKINNSEKSRRWKWERVQATLFRIKLKSLSLQQTQDIGSNSINQIKNILITFIAAKATLKGDITLGTMLSVQYILGQMQYPVKDLVSFIWSFQDAKISMDRMSEIHGSANELGLDDRGVAFNEGDITISNLSFKYSAHANFSLKDITFSIPKGKVTAIVGSSGSGKTTLIKLLLKLYTPTSGKIEIENTELSMINNKDWRSKCSAVLQGGTIFNDTIAKNIVMNDDPIDLIRLNHSIRIANLADYINSVPLGLKRRLAGDGYGMSSGQRQRLLIARAVYRQPEILLFDEATNSLDAENEKIIMENLNSFFQGRTVVIVAHRLSTVKNADNIIVLEKGELIEQGTHEQLTKSQGKYFNLVRNQLELGN